MPAACDKHRAATRRNACCYVGRAIANQEARLKIETVLGGGLHHHARPRLAACASHTVSRQCRFGVMGTEIDCVQTRTAGRFDPICDRAIEFN